MFARITRKPARAGLGTRAYIYTIAAIIKAVGSLRKSGPLLSPNSKPPIWTRFKSQKKLAKRDLRQNALFVMAL